MKTKLLFILAFILMSNAGAHAQCTLQNKAFKSGETLQYKLFFNWKFVWINAGTATMNTVQTTYNGKPAYKAHLITRTSKRLDKFFCMRDTLESYTTLDLVPLYYKKAAKEGGKYRLDEVWYSYPNGKTFIKQRYQNPKGKVTTEEHEKVDCIFDMMSMMVRARSFDPSNYQVGQKLHFLMADGNEINNETLIYRGKKKFKTEDTKITYRCLVFSFVEYEGKKEKEIITFYITDDDNHMPVRLDMYLKFGVAKAYLTTSSGLRNAQTSIIAPK